MQPFGVEVACEFEGQEVRGGSLRLVREFVAAADAEEAGVGPGDFA